MIAIARYLPQVLSWLTPSAPAAESSGRSRAKTASASHGAARETRRWARARSGIGQPALLREQARRLPLDEADHAGEQQDLGPHRLGPRLEQLGQAADAEAGDDHAGELA